MDLWFISETRGGGDGWFPPIQDSSANNRLRFNFAVCLFGQAGALPIIHFKFKEEQVT